VDGLWRGKKNRFKYYLFYRYRGEEERNIVVEDGVLIRVLR